MLRILVAVAIVAAVALAYVMRRRPPRRLAKGSPATWRSRAGIGRVRGMPAVPGGASTPEGCRTARMPYLQIDVGVKPEVARTYGIRSVPTVAVTGADRKGARRCGLPSLPTWRRPRPPGGPE
jgi:hypothetical protein